VATNEIERHTEPIPDRISQYEQYEAERRKYRRTRRLRNQIISYLVALVVMAGLVAATDYGVRQLLQGVGERQGAEAREVTAPPAEDDEALIEDEAAEVEEEELEEEEVVETPIVEDVPEMDALGVMVESCLAELSVEDKVAGLFFITADALTGVNRAVKAGETTKAKLAEYPVGGVIYFDRNIRSASYLTEMLKNTANWSKYPIFLGVDEEGGRVSRVAQSRLVTNVGPMGKIGETIDPQNAYEASEKIAKYLVKYGFNTNFAPVADVLKYEGNETIGDRSFGTDPGLVSRMVTAFVTAQRENGIHATLKHFPGLGNSNTDTHVGMAVAESTLEEMRESDFLPFIAGIEAGAEFVMVGHISLPNIIGDNTPASLSEKIITEVLRGELGFKGIVITDALDMGAISEYYTSDEAAIKAIEAGADMLLMPENFTEAYEGVLAAVKSGRISEERLNESLRRIYRVKYADQVETGAEEGTEQ
jgi:beta-N-acetylhexosaminidase